MTISPTRHSTSSTRPNGRGGAGNMAQTTTTHTDAASLSTPHLKSEVYTTGRGGKGNMARNTDAGEARRAQDVVATPRSESVSRTHVGRGGAANVFRPGVGQSHEDLGVHVRGRRDGDFGNGSVVGDEQGERDEGLVEKGKHWLSHVVGGGGGKS